MKSMKGKIIEEVKFPTGGSTQQEKCSYETSREQEEVVSDAIETVLGGVLELIREVQLDKLCSDFSSRIVTDDIFRLYTMFFIRYDPGVLDKDDVFSTTTSVEIDNADDVTLVADLVSSSIRTATPLMGTSLPSPPEPSPATIDSWARGWVLSNSASTGVWSWEKHERSQSSDDWSNISQSLRSTRSVPSARRLYRPPRKQAGLLEDKPAVPFSLGPDTREDQGLPSAVLQSRNAQGVGNGGNNSGVVNGFGNVTGSRRGGGDNQDFEAWLKELGGREWTVDGEGELLIVDRPGRGEDTTPNRVVTALYKLRDVTNLAKDEMLPPGKTSSSGRNRGSDRIKKRVDSSLVSKEITMSSSASSRVSKRRSSRRRLGRENERFFALEPTLQPNLIHSVGRPGPGVSVCDGSSSKEGPSWPQDPNHMSRTEYQRRQQNEDYDAVPRSVGGQGDADMSSLGFSIGTVQSAPTLGVGPGDGMGDGRGGGYGVSRIGRHARLGTSAPKQDLRDESFSTFDDVNPFDGAVRVSWPSVSSSRRKVVGDEQVGSRRGDIYSLSTFVGEGEPFGHEGPISVGDREENDANAHLPFFDVGL